MQKTEDAISTSSALLVLKLVQMYEVSAGMRMMCDTYDDFTLLPLSDQALLLSPSRMQVIAAITPNDNKLYCRVL
jgi:hypothetical protein